MVSSNVDSFSRFYTNLKTPLSKEKITHTVYKINCKDCNGVYVGQSKQYLENRIKAHIGSVTGKNSMASALKNHVISTGHSFNFEINKIDILNKETNEKRRIILEMVRIKQEKNSVNDKRDTDNLSSHYNQLMRFL